ncbi:CBASS cGAMP-activated phospholipase [Flavobacterium quisquiliarum]|nr:CBASS cGAMP-activated phospholipase [Flavobacterium quisquiliarum]MBW1655917.1 patatin [Flavobacterium quisquiliarum]
MKDKKFKILSIDGGGIRGVFPAMYLASFEEELQRKGVEKWQIYQNFDLICGTSTGGIMAIALALGIPAREIYDLYVNNAYDIFGHKKSFVKQLYSASHERKTLEKLIKDKFSDYNDGKDPILKDCKTNVCIPIFDLLEGKPSVLKNDYHPNFTRDYHIPAYQAALATAAAPTYFTPYSSEYLTEQGVKKPFKNKIDGGVFANNPTLIGIIEAEQAFYKEKSNLNILSIGTGFQKFSDGAKRENWGILYWINRKRKRLIELFMQAQSQEIENLVTIMQNGIDKEKATHPNFIYYRINAELDGTLNIEMDETDKDKLEALAQKAAYKFHEDATTIIKHFSNG